MDKTGGYMTDGYITKDYEERPTAGSSGLAIKDGYLYICQHYSGQIVRTLIKDVTPGSNFYDNTFDIVASHYIDSKDDKYRLRSPNDLVFDSKGDLWFTDSYFGLWVGQLTFPSYVTHAECEDCIKTTNIYRLKKGSTKVELAAKIAGSPSGIGFSPDESTMYVVDLDKEYLIKYDQPMSGNFPLEQGFDTIWIPSDGFAVDDKGLIWASNQFGVSVIDPNLDSLIPSFEKVAKVYLGIATTNVALGDDGDVFVTGLHNVLKFKRATKEEEDIGFFESLQQP
jgi:sugar lactone lactonase YvrE